MRHPEGGTAYPIGERVDADMPVRGTGGAVPLARHAGRAALIALSADVWDPARMEHLRCYDQLLASLDGVVPEALQGPTSRHGELLLLVDGDRVVQWRYAGPAASYPRVEDVAAMLSAWPAGTTADPSESDVALTAGPTRRDFVTIMLASALALATPRAASAQVAPVAVRDADAAPLQLRVNGKAVTVAVEPRVTLLDALREYAGLTGTKKGCDHGQCGACTVHVNGRRVLSCLTLAAMQEGQEITTIEGLAHGDVLDPMQAAFLHHDAFQCGYCTPGQIMSATALLNEPCGPADADVRECLSGNLCRCGAYPHIVSAFQEVRHSPQHAMHHATI